MIPLVMQGEKADMPSVSCLDTAYICHSFQSAICKMNFLFLDFPAQPEKFA